MEALGKFPRRLAIGKPSLASKAETKAADVVFCKECPESMAMRKMIDELFGARGERRQGVNITD